MKEQRQSINILKFQKTFPEEISSTCRSWNVFANTESLDFFAATVWNASIAHI